MDEKAAGRSILGVEFAAEYPLRILVAEDNTINQKLIDRIMAKLGYRIDIVENGLLVLDKIRKATYDLILMDIQMPEMDGLEATRVIRSQAIEQPSIIAMTANAMPEDREVCMQAGMNDYLSKPMKFEDLMEALRKVQPLP